MYGANASHVIALAWESREHGIVFWPFFVARKIPIPYIENRRTTLPEALTARSGRLRYRQLPTFDQRILTVVAVSGVVISNRLWPQNTPRLRAATPRGASQPPDGGIEPRADATRHEATHAEARRSVQRRPPRCPCGRRGRARRGPAGFPASFGSWCQFVGGRALDHTRWR